MHSVCTHIYTSLCKNWLCNVYLHIYMCAHLCICSCASIHVCLCVSVGVYTLICMCMGHMGACIHTHGVGCIRVYIYMCLKACLHAHMHTYVRSCMCEGVYARRYMNVHGCTYPHTHLYMWMHISMHGKYTCEFCVQLWVCVHTQECRCVGVRSLSAYILHMCACLQMYVNKGTYVHGCMYTYMHSVDLHM